MWYCIGAYCVTNNLLRDFLKSTTAEPRIHLEYGPTYAKENTTITLPKCHVTGPPTPEVEWTKVGGSLSPQAVVEDGKLKLFNVTKQDEGEYECTAKNSVGSERSKTKLEVIQVPVKPPEVLVVAKGKDRSIACQATGNIEPRMKWSKSGGDLPARAQTLGDGTLKLTNIQLEDAGEYVCIASVGNFGFTVGKMQLIVPGKPMIHDSQRRSLIHLKTSEGCPIHTIWVRWTLWYVG